MRGVFAQRTLQARAKPMKKRKRKKKKKKKKKNPEYQAKLTCIILAIFFGNFEPFFISIKKFEGGSLLDFDLPDLDKIARQPCLLPMIKYLCEMVLC